VILGIFPQPLTFRGAPQAGTIDLLLILFIFKPFGRLQHWIYPFTLYRRRYTTPLYPSLWLKASPNSFTRTNWSHYFMYPSPILLFLGNSPRQTFTLPLATSEPYIHYKISYFLKSNLISTKVKSP